MSNHKRLAVAIVGSGPSGMYLAESLLEQFGYEFEIDIFDRLPTPYGLVRSGVAPDHPDKKRIVDRLFDVVMKHDRVRFFGNVEIGTDVSVEALRQRYTGIFFAHGMNQGKALGIPGEALENVWTSHDFVAWYNGNPDHCVPTPDLSHERAIIVGNGNVALDIARLLITPSSALKHTDMADHAIQAFDKANVREIVILGRKNAARAAFNNPELEEFRQYSNLKLNVLPEGVLMPSGGDPIDFMTARKLATLERLRSRSIDEATKQITFSFLTTPQRILGERHVQGIEVVASEVDESIEPAVKKIDAGLVISAIGYRGSPITGLPFLEERGTVQNIECRVSDASGILRGVYVCGWARRGPSGVIGTNKKCARQVVREFLNDLEAGLTSPCRDVNPFAYRELYRAVDRSGWQCLDRHERLSGQRYGTPRKKVVHTEDMLKIADV